MTAASRSPNRPASDLAAGRPSVHLPTMQLLRISLYWLGISSIFAGLEIILTGRLVFEGLEPDKLAAGQTLVKLTVVGALTAIVVQPTVGALSDYTASRWGRRKPYIFVGTMLDVVFLAGIALSNELVAIAAFIALLQFSSNLAQGPFQGYVPDLVPEQQVGLASALVGMMQVLGNVSGFVIGAVAVARNEFALGLLALGLLELFTMLSVVIRVRDTRPPKPRNGRPWRSIAAEAWSTDILEERSFLWLLGSRLTILMAGGVLTGLGLFYVTRSLVYDQETSGLALIPVVGLVALGTVLAVVPAARLSDRVGRKKVIYASCAIGAVGLAMVAIAPVLSTVPAGVLSPPLDDIDRLRTMVGDPRYQVALVGAVTYGLSAGAFLAVDWALITDIIPKASSGRYMGISNVATASAGILALALGGLLMDSVGAVAGLAYGPQASMWLAVGLMIVGALLLVPVDEHRYRETVGPNDSAGDPRPAGPGT